MIDLRTCKPGQKLRIRLTDEMRSIIACTDVVTYIGPTNGDHYYDHWIEFSDGMKATRTHDGHVFRNSRNPDDMDVLEVLND